MTPVLLNWKVFLAEIDTQGTDLARTESASCDIHIFGLLRLTLLVVVERSKF